MANTPQIDDDDPDDDPPEESGASRQPAYQPPPLPQPPPQDDFEVDNGGDTVSAPTDAMPSTAHGEDYSALSLPQDFSNAYSDQFPDKKPKHHRWERLKTEMANLVGLNRPKPSVSGAQPGCSKIGEVMFAIGQIESSGNYNIRGPSCQNGDRAYGRYQVMGNNIPAWSKEALGYSMTPAEFLASPEAQDRVAQHKMSQTYLNYGGDDNFEIARKQVASVWFSGRPMEHNISSDVTGTSVPTYIARAEKHYSSSPGNRDGSTQMASASISRGHGIGPPNSTG